MALLGTDVEQATNQEGFGLNSINQMAIALTLPSGGPWKIYRLGAWFAGWNSTPSSKLVLWSGGGSVLRSGPAFNATNGGNIAQGQNYKYEQNITDYIADGGDTVYVGFHRDSDQPHQNGHSGSGSHVHDTAGDSPAAFGGFATHIGKIGAYLFYEAANQAPTTPSTQEPDANEVVPTRTPLFNWTHKDPDGDPQQQYQLQVDTGSGFSSPVADTGWNTSSSSSHQLVSNLTRGVNYYWRVRTRDPSLESSPWSASIKFSIGELPTGAITLPGSDAVAAPMYYLAGSDTVPKFRIGWSFSCPDGGTQSSAIVRIGDAAGTTVHTHNVSGSAKTADISGFTPVNGTEYTVSVQVTCSHGLQQSPSSGATSRSMRARWGRASYRADLVTVPLTLAATANTTPNSGQVILEYGSTTLTTPEPTDWKATIAEVTKTRYVWHRVTLIPAAVAVPVSPVLNELVLTYSNNVLVADKWIVDGQFSVDEGTFVYGTQSLRYVGNGAGEQNAYQVVDVTPDTDYVLSVRIKTVGAPGASFRLRDPTTLADYVVVTAPADTDWTRYVSGVWNSGGATTVRIGLVGNGPVGASAWFDAVKLEASRVVTPWTPGFLGRAVVLDAGGMSVDAQGGGIFRLRDTYGRQLDLPDLLDAVFPSQARHERDTDQAIVTNTVTNINYNNLVRQDDERDDIAVNSPLAGNFTLNRGGWWEIEAGVLWANHDVGRRELFVRVNGVTVVGASAIPTASFGSVSFYQTASTRLLCNAGDQVAVLVRHTAGVNLAITAGRQTFLSIARVRP